MAADKTIMCEGCRKTVPLTEVQYVLKNEDMTIALCAACRNKLKSMNVQKEKKKDAGSTPYFCIRCKYKFKYRPETQTILRCPFCGKNDKVMLDKAPSADKLLGDSDGFE